MDLRLGSTTKGQNLPKQVVEFCVYEAGRTWADGLVFFVSLAMTFYGFTGLSAQVRKSRERKAQGKA